MKKNVETSFLLFTIFYPIMLGKLLGDSLLSKNKVTTVKQIIDVFGVFKSESPWGYFVFHAEDGREYRVYTNRTSWRDIDLNIIIYGLRLALYPGDENKGELKNFHPLRKKEFSTVEEREKLNRDSFMSRRYQAIDAWVEARKLFLDNNEFLYGEISDEELGWITNREWKELILNTRRPYAWTYFKKTAPEMVNDAWFVSMFNYVMVEERRVILTKTDMSVCLNYISGSLSCVSEFVMFDGENEEETIWLHRHFPEIPEDGVGYMMFRWVYEQMREKPPNVTLIDSPCVPPGFFDENSLVYECDMSYPWTEYVYKKVLPVTMMNWGGWVKTDESKTCSRCVQDIDDSAERKLIAERKGVLVCGTAFRQNFVITFDRLNIYPMSGKEKSRKTTVNGEEMDIRDVPKHFDPFTRCDLEDLLWMPDSSVECLILKRVKNLSYISAALRVAKDVYHNPV